MVWWDASKKFLTRCIDYAYTTIEHLFDIVSVVPKTLRSSVNVVTKKDVAQDTLRVFVFNILPFFLASELRKRLNQEQDDSELERTYSLVLLSLTMLIGLYTFRQDLEKNIKELILPLKAASVSKVEMDLCEANQCTPLRFLKGNVRDVVAYLISFETIKMLNWMPAGDIVVTPLLLWLHGRYILGMVLPLCQRHQVVYAKEHNELVLALGIAHQALHWSMSSMMGYLGDSSIIDDEIHDMCIVLMIMIASHLRFASPVSESKRTFIDPVGIYQDGIGVLFDQGSQILKIIAPPLLAHVNHRKAKGRLLTGSLSCVKTAWQHPSMQALKWVFLPKMLQNETNFINDPLIARNWEEIRRQLIVFFFAN